ncbi:MAG: hypothetical protein LBF59_05130 [Prevotellaceae bacterium]|jgi:hypothetical protein|nr:hypothetical protein [Prevotellaceae bacterium]
MFIGYLSSFFIALLLSLFYLSYAASGIFEQIKKEIKNEIKSEIIGESHEDASGVNSFVFDYYADISVPVKHSVFREFAVDISVVDNDIPIRKICLSEYFLRPPPNKL